jgi:hypothetical protein
MRPLHGRSLFGRRLSGRALAARPSFVGGGGLYLAAPVLELLTDETVNEPQFAADFGENIQVGDTVRLHIDDNSAFTSPDAYTDTLDSGEISGGEISFGNPALANDTYYARIRHERGSIVSSWSNTVEVVINAAGGSAGEAIGLLLVLTKAA